MFANNHDEEIRESLDILKAFRKSAELFSKEKEVLGLEKQRYALYYAQIHEFLAPQKSAEGEKRIRELVKEVFLMDLPVCEVKIKRFREGLDKCEKSGNEKYINNYYAFMQEWMTLYEAFYALVAFRSFEHFAVFMEWDKTTEDKVWKPSLDPYNDGGYTGISKPFFYFFNQMVLEKKIKFISKQMFTGGGKSYSNQFAFAWLLGIDKNTDILDIVGNPSNVLPNTSGTVELMVNPRFAKVFPEYREFFSIDIDVLIDELRRKKTDNYDADSITNSMFVTCKLNMGELKVTGSSKINLRVYSKEKKVNGVRCKFLFLDDICQAEDSASLKAHQEDINRFWKDWFRRQYNNVDFYIVVSGTAYSVNDIMSHLIGYYSKGKMFRTKQNKYTYSSEDGTAIFIKIPKIDDDFDRATYPQKFPYEEAIKLRDLDLNTFLAMEQQTPQNPETSPLCYEKINTYNELPSGLSEYSYACLDPARTGKNFVTMGIHRIKMEIDKFNVPIEKHYFVDCIFQLKQMSELYDAICDKVIRHHIINLHIENNTDTSLAYLIEKMLHEKGVLFCEISEVFSKENKEEKIRELVYSNEGYFKNQMVYPAFDLYAPSSEIGKFMLYFTSYDYYKKQEYDDSIDEECMYIQKFVAKTKQKSKAKILYV